jgi:Rod binding domain-containing protein
MEIKSANTLDKLGVNGVVDPTSLYRLKTIGDGQKRAEAVASQLESVFFGMMVQAMRKTVPEGGLLGKGLGGQNYVEMLDQQLSQLNGMPLDKRFHEALVRQIEHAPEATGKAMAKLK